MVYHRLILAALPLLISSPAFAGSTPPNCPTSGGSQALNYLTATNAFSCNTVQTGLDILGTSASATAPRISGDATTGFYTAGPAKVDVAISGVNQGEFSSSGFSSAALNGAYNASYCGLSGAPSWCSGSDIGAWINAAVAQITSSFGGTVIVNPGQSYSYTTTPVIPYNVSLDCQNAKLNYTPTTGAALITGEASWSASTTFTTSKISNCRIAHNLGYTGGNTNIGIYSGGDPSNTLTPSTYYAPNVTYENVDIYGFYRGVTYGNNVWAGAFISVKIHDNYDGVYIPSGTTNSGELMKVSSSNIYDNINCGVETAAYHNWGFFGSSFDYNGTGLCGTVIQASFNVVHFEQNNGPMINLTSGSTVSIVSSTVWLNAGTGSENGVFSLTGSNHIFNAIGIHDLNISGNHTPTYLVYTNGVSDTTQDIDGVVWNSSGSSFATSITDASVGGAVYTNSGARQFAGAVTASPTGLTVGTGVNFAGISAPSNGLAVQGNVGVGTNNPAFLLDVRGATGTQAAFVSSGSNAGNISIDNGAGSQNSEITYKDAGSAKWQIGKSGANGFFVFDNAASLNALTISSAGLLVLGESGQVSITKTGGVQIGAPTGGDKGAGTLNSAGQIYINNVPVSTTVGTVTSVTFTGDGTVLSSTPSSAVTSSGTVTASLANAAANSVLGNSSGSSAAPTYTSSPVLGTSVTAPLLIGGTGTGSTLSLESTSGVGATDAIIFKTGSQAEAARINTSGQVGIGTNNPAFLLDVRGAVGTQAVFVSSGSNAGNISIDNGAGTQNSEVTFKDAGTIKWQIGKGGGNGFFVFDNANSVNAMTISSAGLMALGESGQLSITKTGGLQVGSPTGGDKGSGTINSAGQIYINNTPVSTTTGTVTSVTFTGDGTVLSSTPSSAVTGSGTVTAALATATANTLLGNATGSTAAPTYITAPVVSGSMTAASFIPTSSSTPSNGMFLTAANTLAFATNTSRWLTIPASGGIIVSSSTSAPALDPAGTSIFPRILESGGTLSTSAASSQIYSADANGPSYYFVKSRNATIGSHTVVQSGDATGTVNFVGSDGTHFLPTAQIYSKVDATPGSNDMPGSLAACTTTDGSATCTERFKIDNAGAVYMPSLASSSAATTGTVCWTTATGLLNVDTTTTCLLSLEELKDKHGSISGALEIVSKLEPFWFTWKKTTPEWAGDKYMQPGLGAHQVESVDKRLVAYGTDGKLKGVRYQEMTAVLTSAVKELNQKVDKLAVSGDANIIAANDNVCSHFKWYMRWACK